MPSTLQSIAPPEGFVYQPEFLNNEEHDELLRAIEELDFRPFDFHGYVAKRRIVEYGFEYDFSSRAASAAQPIPGFLFPVRDRAAAFAGVAPQDIVEAVVTEYPPGAPIGWHRDVPQFGTVIGISLAGASRMRFKPYKKEGKIFSIILEPRSIYVMRGPARWQYQHSIPPVENLRYSITFRTLRSQSHSPAIVEML
jgi:alkylated DNA repair dioxygenase AlkB